MKRNKHSVVLLIAIIILLISPAYSQKRKPGGRKPSRFQEKFLEKQFWVGLRGGMNLTKVNPVTRYSAFSSTQGSSFDKSYKGVQLAGHAGIELTFFYKFLSVSFQPGYRRMNFQYSNSLSWQDPTNPSLQYEEKYETEQKLDYLEFPLLLRYEPLQSTIRPYVQFGMYYGRLNNALKATTITVKDQASGGTNEYVSQQITAEAKDLFIRSNMGYILGLGCSVPIGNARVAADVNYIRNTHNITNVANRYENNRLTGAGDILDDVKLRNISLSVSVLIPLRFVILKENYKVN